MGRFFKELEECSSLLDRTFLGNKSFGIEPFFKGSKGVSLFLSAAIYIAIIIAAITLVVTTLNPIISQTEEGIVVNQAKDILSSLDRYISEVSSEGKDSSRLINMEIRDGRIKIENYSSANNGRIYFELEDTTTEIISPGTRRAIGNIIFRGNANVTGTENTNNFTLENKYLLATFNKTANSTNYDMVNGSVVLMNVLFKDDSTYLNGNLTLKINGLDNGSGYTEIKNTGKELGKGEVIAHINSSGSSFEIRYVLENDADFLTITFKNSTDFVPETVSASLKSDTITNFGVGTTTLKYVLGTSSNKVGGLIYAGKTLNSVATGATASINQTYNGNKFYLVFTKGGVDRIDERMDLVKSGQFEKKISPSFAYKIPDTQTITVGLEYDSLELHGEDILEKGFYTLKIFNKGTNSTSGKTMVGIKKI